MQNSACREYFFFMVQDVTLLGWCSGILRGMKNSSKNCRRQQIVKGLKEPPKKITICPMNWRCFTSMDFNKCFELDCNRSVLGIHLFTQKIIFFIIFQLVVARVALNLLFFALAFLYLPSFLWPLHGLTCRITRKLMLYSLWNMHCVSLHNWKSSCND